MRRFFASVGWQRFTLALVCGCVMALGLWLLIDPASFLGAMNSESGGLKRRLQKLVVGLFVDTLGQIATGILAVSAGLAGLMRAFWPRQSA